MVCDVCFYIIIFILLIQYKNYLRERSVNMFLSFPARYDISCLQHLEAVIKSRIPSILAMINKSIDEIEAELNQIGRPLANDAGVNS